MPKPSEVLAPLFSVTFLVIVIIQSAIPCSALASGRFKALYSFQGGNDGDYPNGALVFDQSGNLFGTTFFGGTGSCSGFNGSGCGTVFELKKGSNGSWQHTVLYSFQGGNDGAGPNGGLVFDKAGNLYGTTVNGGANGIGIVFELSPGSNDWTESILHAFGGTGDGAEPMAGLVADSAGNLYGTTWGGGAAAEGAVFEMSQSAQGWSESVIYSLCCNDGLAVLARVALDSSGDLFGVTEFGGKGPYGTIFELKPHNKKWSETTIHSFSGPDGVHPNSAGVTFDKSGSFYGTTNQAGAFGFGTVYRFTRGIHDNWIETVIYNFRTGSSEGSLNSGLAIDSAGNLYGANGAGGVGSCNRSPCGVVYEVTPQRRHKARYRALHQFTGGEDGELPSGDPILDSSGQVYGVAALGGSGHGVVYTVHP